MGLWQGTPWITITLTSGPLSSGDVLWGVLADRGRLPAGFVTGHGAAGFLVVGGAATWASSSSSFPDRSSYAYQSVSESSDLSSITASSLSSALNFPFLSLFFSVCVPLPVVSYSPPLMWGRFLLAEAISLRNLYVVSHWWSSPVSVYVLGRSRAAYSLCLSRAINIITQFSKCQLTKTFCYTQNSQWYCFWPTLFTSRTLPFGQWEILMHLMELEVSEAWNNPNIFCLDLVARFLFTLENPHCFLL